MIVSIVRFRSELSDDEVRARFEERSYRYRDVPGLAEKIYLEFSDSGEFGAVYMWESEEALAAFRETELARTIPDAYRVQDTPRVEIADVCLVVRPEGSAGLAATDREVARP